MEDVLHLLFIKASCGNLAAVVFVSDKFMSFRVISPLIARLFGFFGYNKSAYFVAITVFPRINAAAFIKFFMIWVRRLFEGGVYSRKYGTL